MVTQNETLSNNDAEQSLIDAVKDWLSKNRDGVFGVTGAYIFTFFIYF